MKHLKKGRKFGRERDQRKALLKSMASSFFMWGRIETTEAKAKELRPWIEKCMTRSKTPTLANTRYMRRYFAAHVSEKIFERGKEIGIRKGGYTRIVKSRQRRRDGARMAMLELVK